MRYFTIIFILCCGFAFSQPGGGGGIFVNNFYDSLLQKIDINDNSFSIKLNGQKYNNQKSKGRFFIPPINFYSDDQSIIELEIKYRNEKYKICIQNILPENGGGYSEVMDSIVLDRPYILNKRKRDESCLNDFSNFSNLFLSNGITPYTNKKLNYLGYTYFRPDYINAKREIPWEDLYCKAKEKYCINCENKLSLKYLEQAVKENNNSFNEPILNLRIKILKYRFREKLEFSEEIIDLINKNPDLKIIGRLEEVKAESLINLKRYDEAFDEYEKLEMKYEADSLQSLDLIYKKNKVKFYQFKYDDVIKDMAPILKGVDNDYFLTIIYKNNRFERLNKAYLLYSFSLFLKDPNKKNKEKIAASIYNDNTFDLDYNFIEYLVKDYYMNTDITPEKFEGFKLLFNLYMNKNGLWR